MEISIFLLSYGPWIYENVEWPSNVFFLEVTPLKSGNAALNTNKSLDAQLAFPILVLKSVIFIWLVLNDYFGASEFGVKSHEFTRID